MKYSWESEESKIKRWMRVPAAKKLAWLEEMRKFTEGLPKSKLRIMKALRAGG